MFDGSAPARTLTHAAMSALYFLLMVSTFNVIGVLLPQMVRDLRMDWSTAGLGFTLLGTACGLASMLPSLLVRRIGMSATLLIGTTTLALGYAAFATAQSAQFYEAGALLLGIGFCLCGPVPGVNIIAQRFGARSPSAIGLYFMLGGLGSVLGPKLVTLTPWIAQDWRLFWRGCAIIALLCGAFAAWAVRAPSNNDERDSPVDTQPGHTTRAALASWAFWAITLAYTATVLMNTVLHNFVVAHIQQRGGSANDAATTLSGAALIMVGVSSIAGLMVERLSAKGVTLAALLALSLAGLALTLPQSWMTLALFALAFGIGWGLSYTGSAALLVDWFGLRANLELYAIMATLSTLAALGPVIGGHVRDASGSFAPVFSGLIVILIGAMLTLVATKSPQIKDITSSKI